MFEQKTGNGTMKDLLADPKVGGIKDKTGTDPYATRKTGTPVVRPTVKGGWNVG